MHQKWLWLLPGLIRFLTSLSTVSTVLQPTLGDHTGWTVSSHFLISSHNGSHLQSWTMITRFPTLFSLIWDLFRYCSDCQLLNYSFKFFISGWNFTAGNVLRGVNNMSLWLGCIATYIYSILCANNFVMLYRVSDFNWLLDKCIKSIELMYWDGINLWL